MNNLCLRCRNELNPVRKGEKVAFSVLKEKEVFEILELLKDDYNKIKDIAAKYSVNYQTIWMISKGKTWKHLRLKKIEE